MRKDEKMSMCILVVEDDDLFRELVCDILKKEGYQPIEARDGEEALNIFFSGEKIDLVILDVMIPKYNGWQVLKEMRERTQTPVIMLTALEDEMNEVKGFRSGADDYITKPFSYEVFTARIRRFMDKIEHEKTKCLVEGDLMINQASRIVTVKEQAIELNRKEYQLLLYLIQNKGYALTREQILDAVWGYDFEGEIRTIDAHIKMLRAKLGEISDYIKTIRGSGYKFETTRDEKN